MSTLPSALSAYGRRWELQVVAENQNILVAGDTFNPASPKLRFDIYKPAYQAFWYGDIEVFNLDVKTNALILQQGLGVTLSAGYTGSGQGAGIYGQIFKGKLFQAFVEREDQVNLKTTLHCVVGFPEISINNINTAQAGPIGQADAADAMIQQAAKQANLASLAYIKGLSSTKMLPRGKGYFGDPQAYLNQLADDNNKVWCFDGEQVIMTDFTAPDPNALIYTPTTGIIGTPQQTDEGMSVRVLLDPRLLVKSNPLQIKLEFTSVRYRKQLIGQQPGFLDQDGQYVVASVRHTGDTRDNTWYSDILGITTVAGKLGLMGVAANLAGADQPLNQGN